MIRCNPCKTFVDTKSKLGPDADLIEDCTLFLNLAGALEYLAFTRTIDHGLQLYRSNTSSLPTLMLIELGVHLHDDPPTAIAYSLNQRTKRIDIHIHFARHLVGTRHVRVLHVPFRYQYVDIFAKGLP
ncbi:ribonuclease H-like domain-containing protein [Tanacetum coccineum]